MASKKKLKNDEILLALKDEMRGLATVMQLHTRLLDIDEGQEISNIELRLEFALTKLVEETRIAEAKLKLKAMQDTLKVAKGEWKS